MKTFHTTQTYSWLYKDFKYKTMQSQTNFYAGNKKFQVALSDKLYVKLHDIRVLFSEFE